MKNQTSPYFSIVIPTLNEEVCLPILLNCLAEQSIQDFEVIVVDGDSIDDTVKKAEKFASMLPSFTIIKSKKRGISLQRNLGASKATGEYFLFSDADNQFSKNFLQNLSAKLRTKPKKYFSSWFLSDDKTITGGLVSFFWNFGILIRRLTKHPLAIGGFIGCKRDIFQKIGGFNETTLYGEDKRFAEDALKLGIRPHIFIYPKFILSLRRIRKYGVLKSIFNYLSLNYNYHHQKDINQEKDYPMGGDSHR